MLKTKYITVDEFKEYFGIDLDATLQDDDNPSNKGNAFLLRIEDRVASFLDANFYRSVENEYPEFTDYQKQHYKLALLEQAIYVFKNGDISIDSGYDYSEGIKVRRSELQSIVIAENAKNNLMLCGLWSRKLKGRKRGFGYGWH